MLTIAGRINKLFGGTGGITISLYDAFPESFDTATTPLFVEIEGLDVPLYCERFERRGVSGAGVTFADFDTDLRASELLGREFRMELAEEEESDEFSLEDLIGFAVEASEIEKKEIFCGTVTDYYDSDANPLFEMELDGRQVLIPAAEEFIAGIDFKARTIKFVLPEGLISLEN